MLYGRTAAGGNGTGCGTFFRFAIGGAYSLVYSFGGATDARPGTMRWCSILGGSHDKGTVFRIAPRPFGSTGSIQQLYHFDGTNGDGAYPIDNVIIDAGTLYGMTTQGGSSKDDGTIFALPI